MSLLVKIEQCLNFGYDVSFKKSLGFVSIRLINTETGEIEESALPDRDDHINEKKICDCISYMLHGIEPDEQSELEDQDEEEYQALVASEIRRLYNREELPWINDFGQIRFVNQLSVHQIKIALKKLNEEKPNRAVKEFIDVLKEEMKTRIADDFKNCV